MFKTFLAGSCHFKYVVEIKLKGGQDTIPIKIEGFLQEKATCTGSPKKHETLI